MTTCPAIVSDQPQPTPDRSRLGAELGYVSAPAMENARIADSFDEIADLLELRDDNPFRIRSYRGAAQTVRSLSDRLETPCWLLDMLCKHMMRKWI